MIPEKVDSVKNFFHNFWQPWNAPEGKRAAPVIGFIAATILSLGAFLPAVGIAALVKWAIKHIKDTPPHVQKSAAKVSDVANEFQPKNQELPKNESKPDRLPPKNESEQPSIMNQEVKKSERKLKWTKQYDERLKELEALRTRYRAMPDENGVILSFIEKPLEKLANLFEQLHKLEFESPMSDEDILAAEKCNKEILETMRNIDQNLKAFERPWETG